MKLSARSSWAYLSPEDCQAFLLPVLTVLAGGVGVTRVQATCSQHSMAQAAGGHTCELFVFHGPRKQQLMNSTAGVGDNLLSCAAALLAPTALTSI